MASESVPSKSSKSKGHVANPDLNKDYAKITHEEPLQSELTETCIDFAETKL